MNKLYIIVADDDNSIRQYIVDEIKRHLPNAQITQINDGRDLVDRIAESEFDIAFTDNEMLTLDGMDAIREIRIIRPDLPIYMIAGSGTKGEALEAGATGYIGKADFWLELESILAPYH